MKQILNDSAIRMDVGFRLAGHFIVKAREEQDRLEMIGQDGADAAKDKVEYYSYLHAASSLFGYGTSLANMFNFAVMQFALTDVKSWKYDQEIWTLAAPQYYGERPEIIQIDAKSQLAKDVITYRTYAQWQEYSKNVCEVAEFGRATPDMKAAAKDAIAYVDAIMTEMRNTLPEIEGAELNAGTDYDFVRA